MLTSMAVAGAAFLAGLAQGCTGFGLSLIAVPCLLLFEDPVVVVPTVLILSTINTLIVAWSARHDIRWSIVLPLLLGGVLGFPVGAAGLGLNPEVVKLAVGVFVSTIALILLCGWTRPVRKQKLALFPIGILSGLLAGATTIGGPPAILFLSNQEVPKKTFRASIVTYFCLANCYGVTVFTGRGLITSEVRQQALFLLPVLVGGSLVGIWLAHRVSERVFSQLVRAAALTMGLVLTATSLT